MKFLLLPTILALGTIRSHAAISILLDRDISGASIFTVTETAPNPLLNIANTAGYVLGMEIPTSMFNIPGFGGGSSSDIEGDLVPPIATITEVFSNQSFIFKHLTISADSDTSILFFDPIFLTGIGAVSARFQVASAGPVLTSIAFEALNPGVHTTSGPIFGTVTVNVVPEPSSAVLLAAAVIQLLSGRRRVRTAR